MDCPWTPYGRNHMRSAFLLRAALAALLIQLVAGRSARADEGLWLFTESFDHGTHVQESIAKERKRLQGTWIVVSAEEDGKSDDSLRGIKFTFTGDKVTLERKGKKSDAVAFKLNPTTNPKQIDFEEREPPTLGIYEVKGDEMRLCYGRERPTGFKSAAALLALKREKP